jgi:hypothetical protein
VALHPPPRGLSRLPLDTTTVPISSLYRISGHASGDPYFGTAAAYRFDDRSRPRKARFGTCYCGFDLETAIAETLLHDELPAHGKFRLSQSLFASKYLVRFQGGSLTLADLTGVSLKRLGGDGAISTVTPYALPQLWSMSVHRHPQAVDGIHFVSRHLNDRRAVVVFSRAASKFTGATYTLLPLAPGVVAAVNTFQISFPYP